MGRNLYYKVLLKARFSVIFCLLLLGALHGQLLMATEIRLPSLGGDSSTALLSPQQRELLGEAFMRSLRGQLEIVEQPIIQHYIESLGLQLALQSGDPTLPFAFFVVEDDTINAFAGPSGKIGIHTGLIEKAQNEGELAAVLAHEIAHVTQHHLMRTLESRQSHSLQHAATILATIIAASSNPKAGGAVAATATGLSLQQQINFTRSNEQEADRVGMDILHGAHFDPKYMPAFFKRLQQASKHEGGHFPEYLRTHPLNLSRIADAENRINRYAPLSDRDDREFQRIRQLLLLKKFTHPHAAVLHYQRLLKEQSTDHSLRFAFATAYLQAGKPEKSLQQFERLLRQEPDAPTLTILAAQAESQTGAMANAIQKLERVVRLYPSHSALILTLAELLQQHEQYARAIDVIQQGLNHHSQSTQLYQMLAKTHGLAGKQAQSHLALAQYHFLRGETETALQQLDFAERAARKEGADFILFSTIDERRQRYEAKEALEKEERS